MVTEEEEVEERSMKLCRAGGGGGWDGGRLLKGSNAETQQRPQTGQTVTLYTGHETTGGTQILYLSNSGNTRLYKYCYK